MVLSDLILTEVLRTLLYKLSWSRSEAIEAWRS